MSLRNQVYSQLSSFVDANSGVDLNSYALVDEWALLKEKKVLEYTFDEISPSLKAEYQTQNLFNPVIEILKTSLDDIVIAYDTIIAYPAITDKDALLEKIRALYKPSEEELAEALAKRKEELAEA